ncbi:hypothetical protein Poli38472_002257 [Pythium oligandrum]|uniref:Nuclear pore complex protein n=1 Tax=Pythium oligandrum TaxID=41045 RepID=A0A8K1FI13_PYTOL|nr:hypothetical protein Poli38472_002257 [Pythium oligandrum]|eukprot:TMW63316.1 hypothetical protein Poli38472_002257 [Pythium oligandrum]
MARNSGRRSDNVQRLIDNADQSLSLLASLDDWAGAEASAAPVPPRLNVRVAGSTHGLVPPFSPTSSNDENPPPMSSESFDFTSPPASPGRPQRSQRTEDSLGVVDLAVEAGLLHVKGVFPDHSVEYVDIEPRFTTIGDLKRMLCTKRGTVKDLGFATSEARVMFNGQLVEDDWLVVDCGLGIDGTIYVVKGVPTATFLGGNLQTRWGTTPADPRLPVATIASSYAQTAPPRQFLQRSAEADADASMLVDFNTSLALSAPARGAEYTQKVRPEEANFAEMVSDFYEHFSNVRDTDAYGERLLRGYIEVLQSRLEALETAVESLGRHSTATLQRQRLLDQIKELRDERNTWRLWFELRCICHEKKESDALMDTSEQDPDELHFNMVEDDAVRLLEARNEKYKIQKAVKTWLEHMAMERTVDVSEKRNLAKNGSRTLKLMKKGLINTNGILMDPDAPLRGGDRHIVEDDAEDEAELLKGVWSYVRAGNLPEAVDLCIRLGDPWRASSLSGGAHIGASEVDDDRLLERWGNPMRALWKTTCWKFSEQKNLSLSKRNSLLARQYEEIIYAALSGNATVLTQSSICASWEDHCWAYLQAMTEQQIDEVLHKLLKVKLQSTQLIVGNNAHYLRVYQALLEKTKYLKRYQASLDTLFEDLQNSTTDSVRKQANEPHRLIQAKLVTARVKHIVSHILDALIFDAGDESYDWDLRLGEQTRADDLTPTFLRFAAHFVLFAEFTGEHFDEQASHMILKAYIRHLVKHGQLKLVPVYASKLPESAAKDIYVQILVSVEDRLQRELCLKRILQYSDMEVLTAVIAATVQRLRVEYLRHNQEQKSTESTTNLDRKCMRTIQFLCFYPEHRSEALRRANLMARQFVTEGKFAAVKELFIEHIPEDSIGVINLHRTIQILDGDAIDRAVREYLSWKAYIRAGNHYDLWRSCSSDKHTFSVYSEEKEYLTELMYHVSRSTSAVIDTLHFENGWLLGCSEEPEEDAAIRQLCLPLLVKHLHFIQLESAKLVLRLKHFPVEPKTQLARPLLEKSLQVVDVVADEHYAIADALTPEQCADLLNALRESAIALMHLDATAPLTSSSAPAPSSPVHEEEIE